MPKLLLALAVLLGLAACNTMQGVGKDVSAAGDAVTDEAEDTQDEM